jgi:hypothetical protein
MSPNRVNRVVANKVINNQCHINQYRVYITDNRNMVQLIPANAEPTMSEIDTYIRETRATSGGVETLRGIVREIQSKSGAGALLHPAEEYFVEMVLAIPQP